MTHGDADHINGIQELLQNQKQGVEIDALVLPPEEYMDEKLLHLAEIAKENGTRVLTGTRRKTRNVFKMHRSVDNEEKRAYSWQGRGDA